MGKQAKLKKIRRENSAEAASSPQPEAQSNSDPTTFVNELEKQGYQLQKIQRSPELPNQAPKPKL